MKDLSIQPVHIKYKKPIGKLNSNPIFEILTTGGLYVECLGKGAGFEVIGTGPHRGIARHIAETKHPGIQWSDLAKAEHVDAADFAYLLPKYFAITDQLIERQRQLEDR